MADKLSTIDIAWIAGLLEGEGCFQNNRSNHNPFIQLVMTDKDVVIKAATILGCHKVIIEKKKTKKNKSIYRTNLYGQRAISWMMTVYSLMGERRKQKIEECINSWKNKKFTNYSERKPYSRGAEIAWEGSSHRR